MVDPDLDKDIRQEITCLKVNISGFLLKSERFYRFSQWRKLVETIARLKHIARSFQQKDRKRSKCPGWHLCVDSKTVEHFNEAEKLIIRIVQNEVYSEEIQCIFNEKPLPRDSNILPLSPFLDRDGLLRVGGRLNKVSLPVNEKNPVIIPGNHHIASLIIRSHHELCKHQGRHLTAGAIRSAGFWIIGARRLVSSVLHKCFKCIKLRGKCLCQKMSDLPVDRLEPSPPFTYIGLDTFGPWEIVTRPTHGGSANSKRWAILFTCLTTRGIHIEVVEELSSSSFINAFKWFEAIRGKVVQIRSDQGTNFVGAIHDLKIDSTGVNLEDGKVKKILYEQGTTWKFNPPHSSHMGGVWERLIGVVRRVIDAVMLEIPAGSLTHEVLVTFMAEASAVVNARPIIPLSEDADEPYPLSPSMILTQKTPVIVDISVDKKNMYHAQWKRVQHMADLFWTRWRKEYLNTLQTRRKWTRCERNITEGDIVLLRDKDVHRNLWPMCIIVKTLPSDDGNIRKAEIRVVKQGSRSSTFIRPIAEMVLLLPNE